MKLQTSKRLIDLHVHRTVLKSAALSKSAQFSNRILIQLCREHLHKGANKAGKVILNILQEVKREQIRRVLINLRKTGLHLVRDGLFRNTVPDPAIHTVGNKLTLKNGRCLQEYGWRFDLTCNHIHRIGVEIQVMWSGICYSNRKCVAIGSACSTGTL